MSDLLLYNIQMIKGNKMNNNYLTAVTYYDKLGTSKHRPDKEKNLKYFNSVSKAKCEAMFDEAQARWDCLHIMYQGQQMEGGIERVRKGAPHSFCSQIGKRGKFPAGYKIKSRAKA